jgi:hypothetical protein
MAVRSYLRYRGKRVINCPETANHAAVHVNVVNTVREAAFGKHHIRLDQCSRWPERQNCGQDCLSEIEADPESCMVWHMVDDWYKGKSCAWEGLLAVFRDEAIPAHWKEVLKNGGQIFRRNFAPLRGVAVRTKKTGLPLPASASRTAGGSRMGTWRGWRVCSQGTRGGSSAETSRPQLREP